MSPPEQVRDEGWAAELRRLGGSIHQDDAPLLDEEQEAAQAAAVSRYWEMLDSLVGDSQALTDSRIAAAVLWSLHPIDDYGIYESAYSALQSFTADALVSAALVVLPEWLAHHGDHHTIQCALAPIGWDPELTQSFLAGAEQWDRGRQGLVAGAMLRWARDDEAWEPLASALGAAVSRVAADPIPDSWPVDWRAAAESFRASGRIDLAWDERDIPGSFGRVLALLEISQGSRWREVPDLLNPLRMRRRKEIPGFVQAFDALPAAQQARIIVNVERAWPDFPVWLEENRAV